MNRKALISGAIVSYVTIGFNILSGLFYTPWMVKTIGNSHYALYNLALSVINLFLMDFGIGAAISKFLSNYYARNEEEKASVFLGIVTKIYFLIDLVICVVLSIVYFCASSIYKNLTPSEFLIFKNLYLIVAFYSIISFPFLSLNGILLAKEKFISFKLTGLLQKLATVIFIILALCLGGDVYSLVLVNAFAGLFFTIVKLFLVKKSHVKCIWRGNYCNNKTLYKEIASFSLLVTLSQIAQRLIFNLAPTVLMIFSSSLQITIFSLASTIEGYIWIIGDAVNGMFMPQIARNSAHKGGVEKTNDLMVRVGRFQIYLVGWVVLLFVLEGNHFVSMWMGKSYEDIYVCAVLLILPALLDIPQEIAKTALIISNKIHSQVTTYLIMGLVYICCTVFTTPRWGAIGTAFAAMVAFVVRSILLLFVYRKQLNIDIKSFLVKVYTKWIIATFIAGLCGVFINTLFIMETFVTFLVKCALITLVYFVTQGSIAMSNAEKSVLKEIIKRVKK